MPKTQKKTRVYHPSEKEQFQICPMKWYLRYERLVPEPSISWWLVRGTIVHEVIYHGMEFFDELFVTHIRDARKDGKEITIKPGFPISDEMLEKHRQEMFTMCREYFLYIDRHKIEIIAREVTMNYTMEARKYKGKRTIYEHMGTVDVIAKHTDTPPGMVEIHDYKTGRKWPEEALNRKIQFGDYYYAAIQNGLKPNRVFWGHMRDLIPLKSNSQKTGARKGDIKKFLHPVQLTEGDLATVEKLSMGILRAMKLRITYCNSYGPDSPCQTCGYEANICPKFRIGTEEPPVEDMDVVQQTLEAQALADLAKRGIV